MYSRCTGLWVPDPYTLRETEMSVRTKLNQLVESLFVLLFFNVTELSKINSRHKSQHKYFECDSPPSNNIAELRGFSDPTDRQS